jgi:hypothetical protein
MNRLEDDPESGTGRTTKQMRDAPQRAAFVWPVWGSISYAHDLARHLGRVDLTIITPSGLGDFREGQYPALVVDHAVKLTKTEFAEFDRVCSILGDNAIS